MTNTIAAAATAADQKPRPRFKKPVAWLLGRDLIASLQGTLLYTAFGSKLDPREWMKAEPVSFEDKDGKGEFWFDYIADSGDGMKATYSIAYLSLSNLYVQNLLTEMPSGKNKVEVNRKKEKEFEVELPRGKFLVVGGDTSYHLSDYATLGSRFYHPFRWAFEDLWRKLDEENRTTELESLKFRRPIFGIPGNHDYYDQLDGFRRQFLRPTKPEEDGSYEKNLPDDEDTTVPQLMLPGFERLQNASYVGLQLPFGWWFWGLDTEVGLIDEHQQNFFRGIKSKLYERAVEDWEKLPEKTRGARPELDDFPQKLIMATCSPTTSFGRFAKEDDKKSAESFYQLRLSQPFLPNKVGANLSERSGDAKLNRGQCRLDLSGDYHFYARYWGPQSKQPEPRKSRAERPSADSYASVISGLGGAFHHPSQTFFGDLQEQVLYPPETESRAEFSKRLFDFKSVFRGGGVGVIGFCLAFAIFFTATIPKSSVEILQKASAWVPGGVSPTKPAEPAVKPANSNPENFPLYGEAVARPQAVIDVPGLVQISPYFPSTLLLILSLVLIIAGAVAFRESGKPSRIKPRAGEMEIVVEKDPATEPEKSEILKETNPKAYDWVQKFFGSVMQLKFGLLVLASSALLIIGLVIIKPFRANLLPFWHSVLVFLTLVWSIASLVLSLRYSEWLFKQASAREIKARDWALPWVCVISSVTIVSAGVWLFGKYTTPAYLVTDITLVISTVVVGVLIILLAVFAGGADFSGGNCWWLLPVGFWHAVVQLTIPFLLVSRGNWKTFIAELFLVIIFGLAGWQLMKRNQRWPLLFTWVLFGILMIALPRWTYLNESGKNFPSYVEGLKVLWGQGNQNSGFALLFKNLLSPLMTIAPSIMAGIVGMLMSCIWLGWYLAVSLSFNAHNNEAGGAGRIEKFKEFIRFRLTEKEITGYVIAIDEPVEDGSKLRPHLIDVFTLKVK